MHFGRVIKQHTLKTLKLKQKHTKYLMAVGLFTWMEQIPNAGKWLAVNIKSYTTQAKIYKLMCIFKQLQSRLALFNADFIMFGM